MLAHERRALEPKWGDPNFEAFLHAKHDEIRAAHLAYRIPSLGEQARALSRSEALTQMVEWVQREVTTHPSRKRVGPFGNPFGPPTGDGALFAVAMLRRAGYGVTLIVDRDWEDCMIRLELLGYCDRIDTDLIPFAATNNFGIEVMLPGTAPHQLGRRGVLWCIPRFLTWMKRARERAYAPDGCGARRAAEEFAALASA